MTPIYLHTNSSTQLLLTEKSTAPDEAGASDASMENHALRATEITEIPKEIQGYYHGGLNE
jgi:hypothetical protein